MWAIGLKPNPFGRLWVRLFLATVAPVALALVSVGLLAGGTVIVDVYVADVWPRASRMDPRASSISAAVDTGTASPGTVTEMGT